MLDRVIGIAFEILFLVVGIVLILSYQDSLSFAPIATGIMAILMGRFMHSVFNEIRKDREGRNE